MLSASFAVTMISLKKMVSRFLLSVGIFCCMLTLQSSSVVAQDMSTKDFLAFFADEKGYEFGGVMARTLAEEQVVWLASPESGTVMLKLYSVSEERFLKALVYQNKKDKNQYETKLQRFPLEKESLPLVANFAVDVSLQGTSTRVTLPIQKPGIYYLEGEQGKYFGEMFLVVSNIATQVKQQGNTLTAWTVDSRTGQHVNGGEVVEYELLTKKHELARVSIDGQGLASVSRQEEGDALFVHALGEVAFVPLNYASHIDQPVSYGWWGGRFVPRVSFAKSYSFTDRMLYQPGDTVYFKSLLRRDDDAHYSLPSGLAKVKIWTGWGEDETVIFEKTISISGSGAVDGAVLIPKDAKMGEYYYSVSYGELAKGDGYYFSTQDASFTVEQYRKPEFGLDVHVTRDRLIVGDMVEFELSGNYFSGEPLGGKTLSYTVTAGTYYDYGFFSGESTDDSYRYGGWYGPTVANGEVTLDADGKYRVTVPTESHEKFLPQVYHLEVTAQDAEENPVYESRNVLVLPGDFSLYRSNSVYGSKVGNESELTFQLVANREGVSLAHRQFTTKIHHTRWVNDSSSEKYPYYRRVENDLEDIAFQTDMTGKAALRFSPPEEGGYTFDISGQDERGNTITRQVWLWASDRDGWYYQAGAGEENYLTITPGKESYAPSETVEVTLSSPFANRDVWLSLERASVHRSVVVRLEGNTAKVGIPLEEGDMPNIFLSGTLFSETALNTNMAEIAVSAEAKRIAVELRPDKERYEPGETVSLEVIGTDTKGKPVAGEVAVWAIDKALFELLDQAPADVFKTFWSKRFHSTLSAHSLEGVLFTLNLAERGGCFVGDTPVLMGNGQSQSIQDVQEGDRVMTRVSESDDTFVSARVTGTHAVEVDGYLVLNGDLKVTPEHKMFVNGGWGAAGNIQVGDVLMNDQGTVVSVETIKFVRDKTTVYNLTIDRYHTYFAGGVWVHNSKDGGARSAFKDTAYWNPRVRLGTDGKARVTFKLPDNTTTWVISGIATAGATQFGQARQEISVSKAVLVSESLPTLLRVGDQVLVKTSVRNNTEERLDFVVTADFAHGTISDGRERTVTVEPFASTEVFYTFIPGEPAEETSFQVSAQAVGRGREFSDAIVRTIPIRVTGFMQKVSEAKDGDATFALQFPEDTDRARTSVTLDMAPSLLGTIPTAMRHLIDYPYGCVEQTTSRFVPLVIALKEQGIFSEALKGKPTTAMLEVGIERLRELQNDDGGWGFWHEGTANPYITSYVIEYLIEARAFNIKGDEITAMLAKARTYVDRASQVAIKERKEEQAVLYSRKEPENAFTELVSLAYAKTLLNMPVGKNELEEGDLIPNFNELPPELLALTILSNTRIGQFDTARNGVDALLRQRKTSEAGWQYWDAGKIDYYSSQDAATALSLQALLSARVDRNTLVPAVRSLSVSRRAGYWSNTFATAQVMRALVDFSKSGITENPEYNYTVLLDGKTISEGRMTSLLANQTLTFSGDQLRTDGSQLQISHNGQGDVYSSLVTHIARVTDTFAGESHGGMVLTRRYENVTEPGAVPALGDTVRVNLSVSGVGRTHNRLVIEDTLPAGMVPIHQNFKNEQQAAMNQNVWFGGYIDEYRENGVVMSAYTYHEAREYTSSYLARVVNAGTFFAPPAYAELMYAPEISSYSEATSVVIPQTSRAPFKIKEPTSLFSADERNDAVRKNILWLTILLSFFSFLSAAFLSWQKRSWPWRS